ncbi:MAG: hypothetical protein AAF582_06775 [Pseudomonadota bacterium]
MKISILLAALGLVLSGCASAPQTMDPTRFETELSSGLENVSAVSVDDALTALLNADDLSELQRADTLYLRAEQRLDRRLNLPGALRDFERFEAAHADDERGQRVARMRIFAQSEINAAQERLARLQNLTNWFDDKVLMGALAEGAARYKSSGLMPSHSHFLLLKDSGFICAGEGKPIEDFGLAPDYLGDAYWCFDPNLS